MAGSTFGNNFRVTTFGESHGTALGVIIDGCPAGLSLSEADIMPYMNRRKPGQSKVATPRNEADEVRIMSGVFEGRTTGTPIMIMTENTSQRSQDYSNIMNIYRPGHADYTYDCKYGFRDYRGGGRSSGRETLARVAAGAVAAKVLKEHGITVTAYTRSIGDVVISHYNYDDIMKNPVYMPDMDAAAKAEALIAEVTADNDSIGGVCEIRINGVMPGLGEPVFDKLDAMLSHALFSIGAVKAVEVGEGVNASTLRGSENNDSFYSDESGIHTATNHAGGILGGISNGEEIVLRAHFKATPSISKLQHTVDTKGKAMDINIHGRHDPVIVPRAVVVCEAMCALTIADMMRL